MKFFFSKDRFFEYKADAAKHGGAKSVVDCDVKNRADLVPLLNMIIAAKMGEDAPETLPASVEPLRSGMWSPSFREVVRSEYGDELADMVPEFMERDHEKRRSVEK